MNSISISGQLGKDSEHRAMGDGTSVLSFSVADSQGKDKPTIWWNCAIYGKRADSLQQYLTKGQSVTVVGNVTEREWVDKEGKPRKSMDVRVNDVALQGGKRDSAPSAAPAQNKAPVAPFKTRTAGSNGFDDMDDDIPFANPLRGASRCLAL
jgi:single-strand DNA-binding protein